MWNRNLCHKNLVAVDIFLMMLIINYYQDKGEEILVFTYNKLVCKKIFIILTQIFKWEEHGIYLTESSVYSFFFSGNF
jgi:hypothetical protein